MSSEKSFLHNALLQNHYALPEKVEDDFFAYLELLQQWNRIHNLTAVRDYHDMVYLHILDSLAITPYLRGSHIIDVGTGAGLPGIPLALTQPEKQFVLLDSNIKKTTFLTQVVLQLKINNIQIVHQRVEDFHPKKHFDCVLTRAFASIKVMLNATQHLLGKEGVFLSMKGLYPEKELEEIPENFTVFRVHALRINGLNAERHLVCASKI